MLNNSSNIPTSDFFSKRRIPGPNSSALLTAPYVDFFISGSPDNETHLPVVFRSGEGSYIEDVDGYRYLDFANCLNLPFGHERLSRRVVDTLRNSSNYATDDRINLSKEVQTIFPWAGGFQIRSSGSESVEASLRYARLAGLANLQIFSFEGSYHGLTLGAQQLMGMESGSNHRVIAFPDDDTIPDVMSVIREALRNHTVLLALETTQGARVRSLPSGFLEELAELKRQDERFFLFCDDMLTSIRCGDWMSLPAWLPPDILVAGKSWSGGVPFSLFLVSPRLRSAAGDVLGTTSYGANAMSCASAVDTIQRISQEKILSLIRSNGAMINSKWVPLWKRNPVLNRTHCIGALFGIEFRTVDAAKLAATWLMRHGVLCARIGCVLRFSPPLNADSSALTMACGLIDRVLSIMARSGQQ